MNGSQIYYVRNVRQSGYEPCILLSHTKNGKSCIRFIDEEPLHECETSDLWKCKRSQQQLIERRWRSGQHEHRPRKVKSTVRCAKPVAVKAVRVARYRAPPRVEGTVFVPGRVHGNFVLMRPDDPKYKTAVSCFNDNTGQFMFAVCTNRPQAAGGGNAQVRPREYQGDAVGMPTGPYRSLDEVIDVASYLKRMIDDGYTLDHSIIDADVTTMTAKEIIDKAILRIIKLFIDRRDKDTLYYSQQSPESTNLGLGIFAGMVGADVIEYISKQLRDLPKLFVEYRTTAKISTV
jgi:hypothetical protein